MSVTPELLPREKSIKFGLKALSDSELMAIVFGTGMKGKSVFELCDEVLKDHEGHLSRVAAMTMQEFTNRYKGVGPAKALTLLAALELGSRAAADAATIRDPHLKDSRSVAEYARRHYININHEEFWVIYLRRNNTVIKDVRIGQGGLSMTVVDIRLILREALLLNASSLILTHNHPSGNLATSPHDDALTRRIKDAAELMDLHVLDHVIITDTSFYSYRDNGRL